MGSMQCILCAIFSLPGLGIPRHVLEFRKVPDIVVEREPIEETAYSTTRERSVEARRATPKTWILPRRSPNILPIGVGVRFSLAAGTSTQRDRSFSSASFRVVGPV